MPAYIFSLLVPVHYVLYHLGEFAKISIKLLTEFSDKFDVD